MRRGKEGLQELNQEGWISLLRETRVGMTPRRTYDSAESREGHYITIGGEFESMILYTYKKRHRSLTQYVIGYHLSFWQKTDSDVQNYVGKEATPLSCFLVQFGMVIS